MTNKITCKIKNEPPMKLRLEMMPFALFVIIPMLLIGFSMYCALIMIDVIEKTLANNEPCGIHETKYRLLH
jgi:hypothetical protein